MISEPIYTSTGSDSFRFVVPNIIDTENIAIVGILMAILLVGLVISTEKNKIKLVFESLLGDRTLNQNFREKTTFTNQGTLLLFANYVLCISLLSLSANNIFAVFEINSFQLLSISGGIIVGLFIVKRLVLLIIRVAFDIQKETQEYLFNHSIYTLAAGISLIPTLILLNFTEINTEFIIQVTFVFLLLLIGLRLAKSIALALKHQVGSLSYIFLYICTLEILPLIVIYKAFVSEIA